MKSITRILYVCLVTTIVTGAVVITGCTPEPVNTTQTATHPVITPITTTTTPAQSTVVTTMTRTATLITTTPIVTNEPTTFSMLDLFVPEGKPAFEHIPILITLTNSVGSPSSCDIPITITDIDDPTDIVTWMISVTLDAGETSEILVEGMIIEYDGSFKVRVGSKTRHIVIGCCS